MTIQKIFLFPEHWNYLGVDENLGPVAVSLRREKLEEHKEHGQQYNYRVIFRTSEVCWSSTLEQTSPFSLFDLLDESFFISCSFSRIYSVIRTAL